jgi:SAM-dependent methyltransferase
MNTPPKICSWEQAVQWLCSRPEQRDLVLACYYDSPLLGAADRYSRSEEWRAILPLLPPRLGRALDVGAGRGIASYALAMHGFSVTALEPDPSSLVGAEAIRGLAAVCGLNIEVTQDLSERLPFADKQFDLVFVRAVLHHTADLAVACGEFFRVLKPGGLLLAVREHVISRPEDLPAFLERHPLHKLYGGENAFTLSQYETAIRLAGFQLDTVLSPFDSAINYAPHTEGGLKAELAARISRGLPVVQQCVVRLLGMPRLWTVVRGFLRRVDQRPGRLYSFVARRP